MLLSQDFNIKCPHRLVCLNSWSPAGGAVQRGCGTFWIQGPDDRYKATGPGVMVDNGGPFSQGVSASGPTEM